MNRTNRLAKLDTPDIRARRMLALVDLIRVARFVGTAEDFYWRSQSRWNPTPELLGLSFDEFRRLLLGACHAGLLMRDETKRDGPPTYRLSSPRKAIGSELDAEVEADRRARLALRPGGDLEGQGRLFDEGEAG